MISMNNPDSYTGKRLSNIVSLLASEFKHNKKEVLTLEWLSLFLYIFDFKTFKEEGRASFGIKYEVCDSGTVKIINCMKTYDHNLMIELYRIDGVKIFEYGILPITNSEFESEYFSDREIEIIDDLLDAILDSNIILPKDIFDLLRKSRAYVMAYERLNTNSLKSIPIMYDDEFEELDTFQAYKDDEENLSSPARHHAINKMLSGIKSV